MTEGFAGISRAEPLAILAGHQRRPRAYFASDILHPTVYAWIGRGAAHMTIEIVASVAMVLTIAIVGHSSVSGQGTSGAPALIVTADNGGPATPYMVTENAVGRPRSSRRVDSDDTAGIPLARPEPFGSRLDLNDQEYATRVKQVEGAFESPKTPSALSW